MNKNTEPKMPKDQQREDHVRAQGKDGHPQATERPIENPKENPILLKP